MPCKCGNDEFYMMQRVEGYCYFYVDVNGEPTDNSALHDGLEYKDTRKFYRCSKCDKRAKEVIND